MAAEMFNTHAFKALARYILVREKSALCQQLVVF